VTPYLIIADPGAEIAFLDEIVGVNVVDRMVGADGIVQHASIVIGDSLVLMGSRPGDRQTWPAMLYVRVDDVDAAHAKALERGAASVRAPADQPFGDRNGGVRSPQGIEWWFAATVEKKAKRPAKARKR
jgi:PhnB protein